MKYYKGYLPKDISRAESLLLTNYIATIMIGSPVVFFSFYFYDDENLVFISYSGVTSDQEESFLDNCKNNKLFLLRVSEIEYEFVTLNGVNRLNFIEHDASPAKMQFKEKLAIKYDLMYNMFNNVVNFK